MEGSASRCSEDQTFELCESVRIFFLRWFARLWILQGVVFNADVTVICGQFEVTRNTFILCLQYLNGCLLGTMTYSIAQITTSVAIDAVERLRNHHQRHTITTPETPEERLDILSVLQSFRDHECADARDLI
jgi:hypothetical protein